MIHEFWGNLFMMLGVLVAAITYMLVILGLIVMCGNGKRWVRVLGWVLSGLMVVAFLVGFALLLTVTGVKS